MSQLHRNSNEIILENVSDVRQLSLQKPSLPLIFSIWVAFHAQLAASAEGKENCSNSHCQGKKENVQSFCIVQRSKDYEHRNLYAEFNLDVPSNESVVEFKKGFLNWWKQVLHEKYCLWFEKHWWEMLFIFPSLCGLQDWFVSHSW